MMNTIYILKLKDEKYYIGITMDFMTELKKHIELKKCEWTSKYPIVDIIEIIKNCNSGDDLVITFGYMVKYGIDNVRSDAFPDVHLNPSIKKMIEQSITTSQSILIPQNISTKSDIEIMMEKDYDHYYFQWLNNKYVLKGANIGTEEFHQLSQRFIKFVNRPTIVVFARPSEIMRMVVINNMLDTEISQHGNKYGLNNDYSLIYHFHKRTERDRILKKIYTLINEDLPLVCMCGYDTCKDLVIDSNNAHDYHYQCNYSAQVLNKFLNHRKKCDKITGSEEKEKEFVSSMVKFLDRDYIDFNKYGSICLINKYTGVCYSYSNLLCIENKYKLEKYTSMHMGITTHGDKKLIHETKKYVLFGNVNDKKKFIDLMDQNSWINTIQIRS